MKESEIFGFDAFSPPQIAEKIENIGVVKAGLGLVSMAALGVLAGGFIGLGALYYTIVVSDPALSFATARVLGGVVFSLGLILVIVAGAELFTGNNLMVMAFVSRKISLRLLVRNFFVVFTANFAGACGLALLVFLSGHLQSGDGLIGRKAVAIAEAKVSLPFVEAFFRGVLCNMLVCLAVWIAMAARTVSGKILAIVFPVSAFVAAGFEHCVANMYLIPLGILEADANGAAAHAGWGGLLTNLIPVTLGNLAGGAGLVGLVYWVIYHARKRQ
ncbi:MAG: formate/nitrite transporter family protein [Verrucomicrobiae bacterium]|nr:formate/nitrite transporter family protein [Verrucomicrobiae bacterium]